MKGGMNLVINFFYPGSDGAECVMRDVMTSGSFAEGSFRVAAKDGLNGLNLTDPAFGRFEDDEGNAVDPSAHAPPSVDEITLLRAQVQALTERGEFLEDVIAELAMMVL
jgi:hypothetical protein